jgi:hypothetical protein
MLSGERLSALYNVCTWFSEVLVEGTGLYGDGLLLLNMHFISYASAVEAGQ